MSTIYQFSAYHGLFLAAAILFSKYGKIGANRLLALAVLFFSACLIEWTAYDGLIYSYPHLTLAANPFLFAIAPLLWLYVISYLPEDQKPLFFNYKWLALLPTLLYLIITFRFYLLPGRQKIEVLEKGELDDYFLGGEAMSPFLYVSTSLAFMALAWYQLSSKRHSVRIATRRKRILQWVVMVYLCFSILGFTDWALTQLLESSPINYHLTLLSQTIVIQGIGYIALINPSLWSKTKQKYTQSSLDRAKLNEIADRLVLLLKSEKPYLDMDLNPQDLSSQLEISKHQLSQVISQSLGTTFNDLINGYRIEAAKDMIQSENGQPLKLIHIAYDSGFNNKTTFLRNFKKFTGHTPSEYREETKV